MGLSFQEIRVRRLSYHHLCDASDEIQYSGFPGEARICAYAHLDPAHRCERVPEGLIYWPRRLDPWNWKLKFHSTASTCHFLLCISGDIGNRSRQKKWILKLITDSFWPVHAAHPVQVLRIYCCSLIDPQTVLAAADDRFDSPEYACWPAVQLPRSLPMLPIYGVTYRRDERVNNAIIPSVRLTDPFCWPG